MDWFKIVNIAGEKLSDQELRNAVYTGAWLTDAKRHFSKTNCAGIGLGDKYVRVEVNRQGLLELVLKWISGGNIEQYMADHQHDPNCNELWLYYTSVINWVKTIFPTYRKEMKGLPWGEIYIITDHNYDAISSVADNLFVIADGCTNPVRSREDLVRHGYLRADIPSSVRCPD